MGARQERFKAVSDSLYFCDAEVMKLHPFASHKHEGESLRLCGGRLNEHKDNNWTCPKCGKDYSEKDRL